jgi:hypothetical protein
MPAHFYQVLHITGIIMLFLGYGALLARSLAGSDDKEIKKLGAVTSGLGLIFILVAGFGLVAKLHHSMTAPWLVTKIVIWLLLAGSIVLINRQPALARTLWLLMVALGALAAIMVYWVRMQTWAG